VFSITPCEHKQTSDPIHNSVIENNSFSILREFFKGVANRITMDNSWIKDLIIEQLTDYSCFKEGWEEKFHPLKLIFPKERTIHAKIHSIMTSFGTQTWEPLIKNIATKVGGFTLKNESYFNNNAPVLLPEEIQTTMDKRIQHKGENPQFEHSEWYKEVVTLAKKHPAKDFAKLNSDIFNGIDVWLEKDGIEYIIESKTVQPNSTIGKSINIKMFQWYALRALMPDPPEELNCWLCFPFNPYKEPFYKVKKTPISPLLPSVETKCEDEIWHFISSGKICWDDILEQIISAGKELTSMPNFF